MRRLFLIILLLSLLVPVHAEEILTVRASFDKKTYEGGDRGVMYLILANSSGQLVEDVTVEVRSSDVLFFTKTATIESILTGDRTVEFKFQCKKLDNGVYPVTVSYRYAATSKICQGGICQQISDRKTFEITIRNGEPQISLETNVLTVAENKIVITFRNSDETALDFQFEIECDLTLQYEHYIGVVLSSSSREIVVYGEPGQYQGSVHVRYRDRFERSYEKTFLIRIVIEEEKEEAVVLSEDSENIHKAAQPVNVDRIRRINVASAENVSALQYYVYIVTFSCLFLIICALFAKLKNVGR